MDLIKAYINQNIDAVPECHHIKEDLCEFLYQIFRSYKSTTIAQQTNMDTGTHTMRLISNWIYDDAGDVFKGKNISDLTKDEFVDNGVWKNANLDTNWIDSYKPLLDKRKIEGKTLNINAVFPVSIFHLYCTNNIGGNMNDIMIMYMMWKSRHVLKRMVMDIRLLTNIYITFKRYINTYYGLVMCNRNDGDAARVKKLSYEIISYAAHKLTETGGCEIIGIDVDTMYYTGDISGFNFSQFEPYIVEPETL